MFILIQFHFFQNKQSILSIPIVTSSQNNVPQNLLVPPSTTIFIHITLFLLTILEVLLTNLIKLLLLKTIKWTILIIILVYLMSNTCPWSLWWLIGQVAKTILCLDQTTTMKLSPPLNHLIRRWLCNLNGNIL
jgi:hypothetical protein